MNRVIALFVALAMLLAHALAIHDDGFGRFAFPYEQAYAALRLARNLVYDDQMAWNPGSRAFESYPSMLWVIVCAGAERIGPTIHLSTNVLVQSIGIVAALATMVVLSRFRTDRSASLIAPSFLAASGAFAAGAASGLELSLFALTAMIAFFALERGLTRWFGATASLAVLLHPLGILLVLAMAAIRAFGRPNDDEGSARRIAWIAFTAPIGIFVGAALLRYVATGFLVSPGLHALFHPTEGQWRDGLASSAEFARVGVTPLLLVFPAARLVLGSISRTGAHAVFMALAWCGLVALSGRSPLPFHVAFVPALPFLFLAVQEGMIAALDGESMLRRRLTLLVFGLALIGSAFASRTPANLGPLRIQAAQEAWLSPSVSARFDYEEPLGRLGLQEEIEIARRLRKAGIYLREHVEPSATVLTPWPGSIGYLSRIVVHDLLARTDTADPLERPNAWSRRARADVVSALRRGMDYVVPCAAARSRPPTPAELAQAWHVGLDSAYVGLDSAQAPLDIPRAGIDDTPDGSKRVAEIERALTAYELITVPVEDYTREGTALGRESFLLLRHSKLHARPELNVEVVEEDIRVGLQSTRMPQLAELELRLLDDRDRAFTLRPTGELDPSCRARVRVGLLLYDSGSREIELCRVKLPTHPSGARWVSATARLLNPGSRGEGSAWEAVSDRAATRF